jgi:hypothetical protein
MVISVPDKFLNFIMDFFTKIKFLK